MMKYFLLFIISVSFPVLWSCSDPYKSGLAAYKKGNYEEARKLLSPCAAKGNADAQFLLGEILMTSQYGTTFKSQACDWYQQAAEKGHAAAQNKTGDCYYKGMLGIGKNYSKALEWYRKAADNDEANAEFSLGTMYCVGVGIKQDKEAARIWFLKAAAHGLPAAYSWLGSIAEEEKNSPDGLAQAVEYYRKGDELGNMNSQFLLGLLYEKGTGVPQDKKEARRLFEKAAAGGDCSAVMHLFHLAGGIADIFGGKPRGSPEALHWYKRADELNCKFFALAK